MVLVLPAYSGSSEGAGRAAGGADGAVGGRACAGISCRGLGDRAVFSVWPTSSPLPAMTAIGVLTATCSVPSGITIFASTPSSMASTSIVALSVSISARTSPARTASPSLLSQRVILPSVIVGDNAGIRTWVAISQPAKDVIAKGVRRRPRHPSTALPDPVLGSPGRTAPPQQRDP